MPLRPAPLRPRRLDLARRRPHVERRLGLFCHAALGSRRHGGLAPRVIARPREIAMTSTPSTPGSPVDAEPSTPSTPAAVEPSTPAVTDPSTPSTPTAPSTPTSPTSAATPFSPASLLRRHIVDPSSGASPSSPSTASAAPSTASTAATPSTPSTPSTPTDDGSGLPTLSTPIDTGLPTSLGGISGAGSAVAPATPAPGSATSAAPSTGVSPSSANT